jgi:hypothetical protein
MVPTVVMLVGIAFDIVAARHDKDPAIQPDNVDLRTVES